MHEWRWCWQDFCSSGKKLEAQEHWGWHKAESLLCFLLIDLLRLDLLILNPMDKKLSSLGYRLIDTCHFSMNTRYNCSIIFGVAIWWTIEQCYWLFLHFCLTQSPIGQLEPVFFIAIGNSVSGCGFYFLIQIGMNPNDVQERSMALTGRAFKQINTRSYPSSKTWNVDIKHWILGLSLLKFTRSSGCILKWWHSITLDSHTSPPGYSSTRLGILSCLQGTSALGQSNVSEVGKSFTSTLQSSTLTKGCKITQPPLRHIHQLYYVMTVPTFTSAAPRACSSSQCVGPTNTM